MVPGSYLDHHSSLLTVSLFPLRPSLRELGHLGQSCPTLFREFLWLTQGKDQVATWPRELQACYPCHLSDISLHTPPCSFCSSHTGFLLLLKYARNISSSRPLHKASCLKHSFRRSPHGSLLVLAKMSPSHRGLRWVYYPRSHPFNTPISALLSLLLNIY